MKISKSLFLGIISLFIGIGLAFAQDEAKPIAATEPGLNNSDVQWVWGEAVDIDAQNKAVVIKYLDYEVDQEKEITIGTDDKTTYENIKSLDEIKPKDVLSVDYINAQDGKSIARTISLEKPEEAISPQSEEKEKKVIEKTEERPETATAVEPKAEEPVGAGAELNKANQ